MPTRIAGKGKDAQHKQKQTSAQRVLYTSAHQELNSDSVFHMVPCQVPAGAHQHKTCFLTAAVIQLDFILISEKLLSDYIRSL